MSVFTAYLQIYEYTNSCVIRFDLPRTQGETRVSNQRQNQRLNLKLGILPECPEPHRRPRLIKIYFKLEPRKLIPELPQQQKPFLTGLSRYGIYPTMIQIGIEILDLPPPI